MSKPWNWTKALGRLAGNWMTAFFSPLAGANIALNVEFLDSVYLALISSIIISGIAGGQMLNEWSKTKC